MAVVCDRTRCERIWTRAGARTVAAACLLLSLFSLLPALLSVDLVNEQVFSGCALAPSREHYSSIASGHHVFPFRRTAYRGG
jgi:hypothetical protein